MITEIIDNQLSELDETLTTLTEKLVAITPKPVSKYHVIRGGDCDDVTCRVNAMISKGWQPHGTLSVTSGHHCYVFVQVMVRRS